MAEPSAPGAPPKVSTDTMQSRVPAYRVCGVRIDAHQIDTAVDVLLDPAARRDGLAVHLVNAGTLALGRQDPELRALLNRGDLNLPDGMPLVWIARRLGLGHVRERVYGPDLMLAAFARGEAAGVRHFLYGSTPAVIDRLGGALRAKFPNAQIVGAEAPPFRALAPAEADALVARVRAARADIVWVGLGTPKQDVFVDAFRTRLGAALVAVGAAFDFHAGTKPQAPVWVRRAGLEWLYRFLREPRRLWRRYLVGNARFVAGVLRDRPSRYW
jgi:N-acetylglucosaminyldiphosphoundecaprenol N-acetyl-beta-D-mannosaminyltransferase